MSRPGTFPNSLTKLSLAGHELQFEGGHCCEVDGGTSPRCSDLFWREVGEA